ncbi:hypothetical protein [Alteromonas sp. a30]|uniref:hypothetical protein n=1 Tax=Alteromonas sp. a30 TaxID=2730917 RepID=UPI0022817481|nr:hypothetical protein [Alteromonas sp. a30]MCY7297490.1 hypothetical protein [Alteromonas sp. a30]
MSDNANTIKVAVLDGLTITNFIYIKGDAVMPENYVQLNDDCYAIGDVINEAHVINGPFHLTDSAPLTEQAE